MAYNLLISGIYLGYNPFTNHLLTSWDIQEGCQGATNASKAWLIQGEGRSTQRKDGFRSVFPKIFRRFFTKKNATKMGESSKYNYSWLNFNPLEKY